MTFGEWLTEATSYLNAADVQTARLDATILLEDCVLKNRAWVLAHPESKLSSNQVASLKKLLRRRSVHEPLAYVRGKCEFYGREFVLSPAVLQPRPESEAFIQVLKELASNGYLESNAKHVVRIADVGAGSGALGITAALELPYSDVVLLELDPKAAEVAKVNVDKFTLNLSVTVGDLVTDTERPFDVFLCNLPYVPDGYQINKAATYEPRVAIFGGPDGLDVYRRLFDQVQNRTVKPLFILTESFPPQHEGLQQIARPVGYSLFKTDDFIQVFQRAA
ncbi:MAG TPA: HemK/PrmC family methyltransferase [Candidatus Dormibacteraeota bacterium]|nr:HemK/PrmC family methyltransferase [Candidatus Dormibacteraeota bacterium]